ncbi:hypothetical protein FBEOM_8385 [Fusarium beomiforme]|uniref:Uncharacterized protein n=1 Tax=Fusarium beomiforme TaxID=44412 RepID=A0A9P5AGW9_9HYPO|nr:hypothetical protein FBEOM_8385 [Fusarium beomiforme]
MEDLVKKDEDSKYRPPSMGSTDLLSEHDIDAFEQFESYRQSANRHLKNYFESIDVDLNHDDLPGLRDRPLRPQNPEADESARISRASAVQDLIKLDNILGSIKKQKRPYINSISPIIATWTVFCCVMPYFMPQTDSSVIYKAGGIAGAFSLAVQLFRKFLQSRKITPLQHKVRGLVRAFKNGTIRYRDWEEVLIPSLN